MAFFIKADHPSYDWRECLDASSQLTNGHKWELFILDLSFIGFCPSRTGRHTFLLPYLFTKLNPKEVHVMNYTTHGVCSRAISFEVKDNKVTNVHFVGGCSGNTQGVAALVEGMDIDEAIKRMKGI